jgi:hypothetical protein
MDDAPVGQLLIGYGYFAGVLCKRVPALGEAWSEYGDCDGLFQETKGGKLPKAESRTSGAEDRVDIAALTARLKSCPDTSWLNIEVFRSL